MNLKKLTIGILLQPAAVLSMAHKGLRTAAFTFLLTNKRSGVIAFIFLLKGRNGGAAVFAFLMISNSG